MRILGNILWHFPFLGFIDAILTFLLGSLFTLTVVGAPVGLGLLQLSKFLFSPFTTAMIYKKDLSNSNLNMWSSYSFVIRIIYIPIGIIVSAFFILRIVALFASIVGIPAAIVAAKSLPSVFNPVSRKCVPVSVKEELEKNKAKEYIAKQIV